jgi:anti-sigma regulatory factor (Ser/Thr protein kinase)
MSASSGEPASGLRRDYEGDLATLRSARRDVIDWLAQHGADEATKERAALIVSELTSNAIQASPGMAYTVHVARLADDLAEISVRNHPTKGLPPAREHWRPVAELSLKELSLRGRGLAIVDSLSEDVTVAQHGDEVIVTARVRIDIADD